MSPEPSVVHRLRRVTVRAEDGVRLAGIVVPGGHGAGARVRRAESGAPAPLVGRIGRWASATIDG